MAARGSQNDQVLVNHFDGLLVPYQLPTKYFPFGMQGYAFALALDPSNNRVMIAEFELRYLLRQFVAQRLNSH
jgi:hypothetical protein